MKLACHAIRCRPVGAYGLSPLRANMLPVANVCMMLLPFLLLCSPGDVLRVFNIATGKQAPGAGSVQLRVSNHGMSLTIGPSILASGPHPAQGTGFPAAVAEALTMLVRTQPDADIIVQPDASATYADVLGVLDTLHAWPEQASGAAPGRRILVAPVASP